MSFFKGVTFVGWGMIEQSSNWHDTRFENYYGIQYNHEGRLRFAMNGRPKRIVDGAYAFITRPGPRFEYGPPAGESRSHNYVCFRGPRVDEYVATGLLPILKRSPLIPIARPESFMAAFSEVVERVNEKRPDSHARAVHGLEGLLLQLGEGARERNAQAIGHLRVPVESLLRMTREEPSRNWDFHSEAKKMGVSYPHFRRVFRQMTGSPPGRFLQMVRLDQAARLLRESDERIGDVAEQVGVEDPFRFSKIFKKRFHLSPRVYRAEFRRM